ncbi:MAG: hypothetical protein ABWY71_00295 [Candidatus Saccharimonadales bacterium]
MVRQKIQKHIEIVRSTRAWPGSMREAAAEAIYTALSKNYTTVSMTIVNNVADLEALVERKPDLVFLGIKFTPLKSSSGSPDKIWISEYLDQYGIPYTGSDQNAHMLDINKPLAKQRVLDAGLNTSPYFVARQGYRYTSGDISLALPVFIKPADRGDGYGIDSHSLAHNFDQLQSKIQSITADLHSDSLIEEYLPGREFSVAILRKEYSDSFYAIPLELVAPLDKQGARILTEQVKSLDTERSMEVADEDTSYKVCKLAVDAFSALGARDYGRIDIRMDKNGTPHFLEANLLPSLRSSPGNYFPKACLLSMGMSYEAMILHIVRLGLNRTAEDELTEDAVDSLAFNSVAIPAAA